MQYLVAQAGFMLAQEAETDNATGSLVSMLLVFALIGGFFYFVMIRPQRRRMREMDKLRDSIVVGDEIRTVGGIYAVVKSVDDDDMMVDIGGGTSMRISRRAIARRLGGETE